MKTSQRGKGASGRVASFIWGGERPPKRYRSSKVAEQFSWVPLLPPPGEWRGGHLGGVRGVCEEKSVEDDAESRAHRQKNTREERKGL